MQTDKPQLGTTMRKTIKIVNCKVCNNPIKITSSSPNKKYCSTSCYREFQRSGNYKIEAGKNGKEVKCSYCEVLFYVPLFRLKRKHQYCTKACYLNGHSIEHKIKNIGNLEKEQYYKKVECDRCGKEIVKPSSSDTTHHYCSDDCRSNKERVSTCVMCKTDFSSFEYRKAKNKKGFTIVRPLRKTCSYKCQHDLTRTNQERKDKISKAFTGPKHPNYIHHPLRSTIRDRPTRKLKEYIFKLFDSKCFKCGSDNKLAVDHHTPNIKGGCLNENNAVLLCFTCNSKKSAKSPSEFYTKKELNNLRSKGIFEDSIFCYS